MLLSAFVFLQLAFAVPQPPVELPQSFATATANRAQAEVCKSSSFFGIPNWYKYLPDNNFNHPSCSINNNFVLLGQGANSGLLLIILALVDILLRVAALVAVAFVIVGGFRYMAAQGEPGNVKSATQTLVGALVGLVIAIIATAVVSFIGTRLGA